MRFMVIVNRVCIHFEFKFSYLLLFCFAYIGKILLFLAYWTVANDLCDSREAKSIFPIIGAGGVLGGTLACFSTAWVVKRIGPSNLLLIWISLLMVSLYIMYRLSKSHKKELSFITKVPAQKSNFFNQLHENIGLISKEPLLRSISVLYFMIFFLLISLDFHFFVSLKDSLTQFLYIRSHDTGIPLIMNSPEFNVNLSKEISRFLGIYRGLANTLTFFIQIGIAGFILKVLGTARSILLLPVLFTCIFFACFIQAKFQILPASFDVFPLPFNNTMFLIIIAGMASRIAIFDSLFSPNFQIFFSSLPAQIRGRGKMFIEGIAKPLAILLAGGSVFFVGSWLLKTNPELIWIHFLILFLIGLGLCCVVFILQKSYADSISGSLGGNKAAQIANVLKMEGWKDTDNIVTLLIVQMFDPDEDIKNISLEILSQLNDKRSEEALFKILNMSAYKDRPKIIYALGKNAKLQNNLPELETWLWDKDKKVIAAAIDATRYLPFSSIDHLIRPYIQHEYSPIASRAIAVMWPHRDELLTRNITGRIERLLESDKPEDISLIMATIAELSDIELLPFLEKAKTKLAGMIPSKETEIMYIECLAHFANEKSIEKVLNSIHNTSESFRKRIFYRLSQHLPFIQKSLVHWLQNLNIIQRHYVLELLFRQNFKASRGLHKIFMEQLKSDIAKAYHFIAHLESLQNKNQPEITLLMHSIIEGPLFLTKLNISYLLALAEPSGRLFFTVTRLMSPDKFHKTTAIEALETIYPRELHARVSPLFLETDLTKLHKLGKSIWKEKDLSIKEVLDTWLNSQHFKWPMTCALFHLISNEPSTITEHQKQKFHALVAE
ncbi:MAG: hypothetical protein HQK83_16285 [Fibrobacteria bacterium]|nr:hypothetical protein [Fibrobacteria bacterium]